MPWSVAKAVRLGALLDTSASRSAQALATSRTSDGSDRSAAAVDPASRTISRPARRSATGSVMVIRASFLPLSPSLSASIARRRFAPNRETKRGGARWIVIWCRRTATWTPKASRVSRRVPWPCPCHRLARPCAAEVRFAAPLSVSRSRCAPSVQETEAFTRSSSNCDSVCARRVIRSSRAATTTPSSCRQLESTARNPGRRSSLPEATSSCSATKVQPCAAAKERTAALRLQPQAALALLGGRDPQVPDRQPLLRLMPHQLPAPSAATR